MSPGTPFELHFNWFLDISTKNVLFKFPNSDIVTSFQIYHQCDRLYDSAKQTSMADGTQLPLILTKNEAKTSREKGSVIIKQCHRSRFHCHRSRFHSTGAH
mmetsp:Transcript_15917/g.23620  ORF Transcript_15917/g.23620 Transcript_15917/m.23620 type:complete len:101 (-) Transcript_15917:516-818(-)